MRHLPVGKLVKYILIPWLNHKILRFCLCHAITKMIYVIENNFSVHIHHCKSPEVDFHYSISRQRLFSPQMDDGSLQHAIIWNKIFDFLEAVWNRFRIQILQSNKSDINWFISYFLVISMSFCISHSSLYLSLF